MKIQHFFDPSTSTLSYVVFDPKTKDAVVLDTVWNYDPKTQAKTTRSIDEIVAFIKSLDLELHYILDTHAHADHISGMMTLKRRFPEAKTAVGAGIVQVQETFKSILKMPEDFKADGSQFESLLSDGQIFSAGSLTIKAMKTPGHTPACMSFLFNDLAVFTGDCLFMPDFGVGRCDFPGGSAKQLFHSITEKLYTLSDSVEVYVGHDYMPNNRELRFRSDIGEEKSKNIHLRAETSESDFVKMRQDRDHELKPPKLLNESIRANIDPLIG